MAKKPAETWITILGNYENRGVLAVMVGQRVAVHAGFNGEGWTISDPVTGRAYWWTRYGSKATALRKARAFVREFGTNPLRGMKMRGETMTRKPPRVAEMREFFYGRHD